MLRASALLLVVRSCTMGTLLLLDLTLLHQAAQVTG
jgi:hypothetical protein